MILTSPNIAIAESRRTAKWSCVKTHTAKSNGFTGHASRRKNYPRNGFAVSVVKKSEWPNKGQYLLMVVF